MNDNTRIRIKVPAHLYESVKKQLTLKEGKNQISEMIRATPEELKAFYFKVREIEAGGTDIDSALEHALFDINNQDAAEELSLREASQNFGMPGATTVKEKKAPGESKPKVEGYKAPKEKGMQEEMTLEERVMELEKTIKELKKGMKPKEEGKEEEPKEEGAMAYTGATTKKGMKTEKKEEKEEEEKEEE